MAEQLLATLKFQNDNAEYDLVALTKFGKIGPEATMEKDNLNLDDMHKVIIENDSTNVEESVILFFKQHGRFTILTGRAEAEKQLTKHNKVKGRIVSSPVLKKAQLNDAEVVAASEKIVHTPVFKKSYSGDFANMPRINRDRDQRYRGE